MTAFSAFKLSSVFRALVLLLTLGALAPAYAQRVTVRVPVDPLAHSAGVFPVELGNMLVGTSATRALIFTNRGSEATTVGAVTVAYGSGVALSNNTCSGQVLAQNASCTVDATVTVDAAGPYASSVQVAHSTNPTPDVYNFTATGVARDESLVASPDTVTFGFVGVNTASDPQTVTVTNNGNVDATLTNVFVQGNASMYTLAAGTCVTTLEPGASCSLTVAFTPTSTGSKPAQLMARRGGVDATLATLSGTGGQGVPQFSQSLMRFDNALPGVDAPTRSVTLTNVGNARLDFSGLGIEGDSSFRVASTTCTTSLAVGQSCAAEVTVRPPDGQSRAATLLALAPSGVRQVSTVELAVQPAQMQPTLEVLPASLSFPATGVGGNAELTLELRSVGLAPVNVSAYSVAGSHAAEFSVVNAASCTGSLPPGNACTLTVRFAPSAAGGRTAALRITSDSTPAVGDIALAGTGIVGELMVNPLALDFGTPSLGTSPTRVLTLTSTGTVPVTVGAVSFSGAQAAAFTASGCTGQALAPGAMCTMTITHTPAVVGAQSAALAIAHNGASAQRTVTLSASATPAPAGVATLGAFSCTSVGAGQSSTCTAELSNTGNAALTVSSVTRDNTAFAAPTHNCGASLAAGASCTITMGYSSMTPGSASTTVTVATSVGNATGTASVVVAAPTATLTAGTYAATTVGTAVSATHTVRNTSAAAILGNFGTPSLAGSGMMVTGNTCTATLAPNATCTITTRCDAAATGTFTATLSIASNAGALSAPLSCSVAPVPVPGMTLGAFSCTAAVTGQTSTCTATLSNTGEAPVTVGALSRTGTVFSVPTSNCPATLAVGQSCTVTTTASSNTTGTLASDITVVTGIGSRTATATVTVGAAQANLTAGTFGAITATATATQSAGNTATSTLRHDGSAGTVQVTGVPTLTGSSALRLGTSACTTSTVLSPGQTCTVPVWCSSPTAGTYTATLAVPTNAGNKTASLSCVVSPAPAAVLDAGPFACNTVFQGQTTTCTAPVRNVGNAPMVFSGSPARTGTVFAAPTHNCGTTLAAGASCTLTMSQVLPAGTSTTTVTWSTSGGALSLPATATVQAASATLTSADVTTQAGAPANVVATLTNTGAGPLTFTVPTSTALSGAGFTWLSTTCTASPLASGASCELVARCTASAVGTNTANFSVTTAAGTRTASAQCRAQPASGTVTSPYGDVTTTMGTGSRSGNWRRVTNTGVGSLTLSSFAPASGVAFEYDTANAQHCAPAKVLAPGASCDLFERFDRNALPAGSRVTVSGLSSAVSTTAGALSWMSSVEVAGVSVALAAGQPTLQQGTAGIVSVRLTNNAAYDLTSATYTVTGMTGATGCPATLAAGASCTLSGTATPAAGATSHSVSVTVSGRYPQVVNGTAGAALYNDTVGQGTVAVPVAAPSATFTAGTHANVDVGSTNTAVHTLTNTGAGAISVGAPTVSGAAFSLVSTTCGSSLAAGASCTVTTRFAPTAAGTASGSVTVSTAAGSRSVSLSAFGTSSTWLSPTSIDFGTVNVGSASAARTLVVSNGSPSTLSVSSLSLPAGVSRAAPGVSGDCPTTLPFTVASGASCNLRLSWTPAAEGNLNASATMVSNYTSGNTTVTVSLTGVSSVPVGTRQTYTSSCGFQFGMSYDSVHDELFPSGTGNSALSWAGGYGGVYRANSTGTLSPTCVDVSQRWKVSPGADSVAGTGAYPNFPPPSGYNGYGMAESQYHAPSDSYIGLRDLWPTSTTATQARQLSRMPRNVAGLAPVPMGSVTVSPDNVKLLVSKDNSVIYIRRFTYADSSVRLYRYNPASPDGQELLPHQVLSLSFTGWDIMGVSGSNPGEVWLRRQGSPMTIRTFNPVTGQLGPEISTPHNQAGGGFVSAQVPFSANNVMYYVTFSGTTPTYSIRSFNTVTGAASLLYTYPQGGTYYPRALQLSADDKWLYVAENSGALSRIRVAP